MENTKVNTNAKYAAIIPILIAAILALNLTACSFGVEIGYHGLTGVSNTTASALANSAGKKVTKERDY